MQLFISHFIHSYINVELNFQHLEKENANKSLFFFLGQQDFNEANQAHWPFKLNR
jgi:hypothetical protein